MKAVWGKGGAREIPQRRAEYLVWQVWSDLDPLSATPSWIWWARAELDLRGEPVPGETQARLSPGRGLLASANTCVTLWMCCLRFPPPYRVSPTCCHSGQFIETLTASLSCVWPHPRPASPGLQLSFTFSETQFCGQNPSPQTSVFVC